jgi:hypothetical protein
MAIDSLRVVDVEKVRIQECLDYTCHDGYRLEAVLCEVTVNPIRYIESAVEPQGKEVMCGDSICFSGALEHKKLWKDSDGFKPYGKGPKYLEKR